MAVEEREAAAMRPGDIEGQRFTIGKRGYEPEEVQHFLSAVADQVGRLEGEIEWHRARFEHLEQRRLAAQEAAYDRISQEFMDVVRRADEAATQVRSRAEEEARAAVGGAREDASRMVAQAAGEAERILVTARTEAERLVADATDRVERLIRRAGSATTPARDEGRHVRNGGNGHPTDVRTGDNGHTASSDYFGTASGQVTVPEPSPAHHVLRGEATPDRPIQTPSLQDPVFRDLEGFDLDLDGSLFDLLGE